MQSNSSIFFRITSLILAFCCSGVMHATQQAVASSTVHDDATKQDEPKPELKSFVVVCHSGTVLTVEIPDQSIQWIDLSTAGRMLKKTIRLHDIRQAILGREAAGAQVAMIRKLLDDLKGDDYWAREAAEKELVKPDIGGRFRNIIEAEKDQSSLEFRYRVQRVLSELDKRDESTSGAFDQIQLQDGSWQTGDLGEFSFECQYRDQPLKLTRVEVAFLNQKRIANEPRVKYVPPIPFDVKVFQRFGEPWNDPQLTKLDFESLPNGEPLVTRADVSRAFVSKGLIIKSERAGYVGISGYAFRSECPPKQNSICVFESVGTAFQRFKGIMEFSFCLPNQPQVAAGVHQFGLWVSRVDEPRDFILEAYNSEGQLVGTAEASNANCTFHGILSSEPFVKVRLLSNPYLFNLQRKVDEDYCVDDICFSEPIALTHLRPEKRSGIMTKSGDFLMGNVDFSNDKITVALDGFGARISVPLEQIRSIVFPNLTQRVGKGQRVWYAMLRDRSVVAVDPSNEFQSQWFGAKKVDRKNILAIWLAPNDVRFPGPMDFEAAGEPESVNGSTTATLVYPGCRIITADLEIDGAGYRWSKFEKREQDLWIRDIATEKEEVGPREKKIVFAEMSSEQIPTLWFKSPPNWEPALGMIRLTDGQQFVIGGVEGIEIAGFNDHTVTLNWGGTSEQVPFSLIETISWPQAY